MDLNDVQIWLSDEDFIDKYTVVYPDGSYVAMNDAPYYPQGFCQHGEGAAYCPECEEIDHPIYGKRLHSYLGTELEITDLPDDCQSVILGELIRYSIESMEGGRYPQIVPSKIVLERVDEHTPKVSIERLTIRHSPTGFEWGYLGSGPADLALNILQYYVSDALADKLYQKFKFDIIAEIPYEGTTLLGKDIVTWLINNTEYEEKI